MNFKRRSIGTYTFSKFRSHYGIKLSQSTVGYLYFDLLENPRFIIFENEACPTEKNCGYIDTLKNILWNDNYDDHPNDYIKFDT